VRIGLRLPHKVTWIWMHHPAAHATGATASTRANGFLSENAQFAERCSQAGLTFIGPTPENIRAFGLKHTAREIAARPACAHGGQ